MDGFSVRIILYNLTNSQLRTAQERILEVKRIPHIYYKRIMYYHLSFFLKK